MDIVVIDAPNVWGMLLSRNFAVDLGGYIQMDLSKYPPTRWSLNIHLQDGTTNH